jgi:uncharacterized protein (TIGR02996 family)
MEERGFIRAITERPADDTNRLVYADWLEERSDPRADFLRAECRLAAVKADDRRLLLLAPLLRLARGCDRGWLQQVSRAPIPPVTCELDLVVDAWDPQRKDVRVPLVEVQLTNDTPQDVCLEYRGTSWMWLLDLVCRDVRGFTSTRDAKRALTIPVGGRVRSTISPISHWKKPARDGDVPLGDYTVQPVFEYRGWVATADPVPFVVRRRRGEGDL